ncbi:conserved hypothetical protein [Rhodopseudomonas palustris HaA2]|uniref:Uncharacterized protein n=1 Tax=Rhodopseudomonas palustris (strain HaA2) TaxID=316058 RepID=Q2IZZ2_RHOP2|nr:hypothetical protein [Rhodopseudomonas palustris]ABD06218.1 conserved hypothetical protein [Rhodopseudomonas palustris HaA2]
MIGFGRDGWIGALLVAAALQFASTGAVAYTADQQQACTGDAMRLCGAFVPDVDRITVCMVQNKTRLTPACRAHFGPPPRARAAKAPRSNPAVARSKRAQKPAQREFR